MKKEKSTEGQHTITEFGYEQELKRVLSVRDMVIYGMIFMVPIAPFGIYGYVVNDAKGMIALAYSIGLIAMIFTALSYKRMSEAFPISGSVYSYSQRAIHPVIGFLTGWVMLMDYILVPALLYIVAGVALQSIIPGVPLMVFVVSFIVINTAINIRGIEFTAKTNLIILIGQLIVLSIFIVLGLIALSNGAGDGFTLKPFYNPDSFSFKFVLGAVSLAVLSFLGFDGISTLAEEAKDGSKAVGTACVVALFAVGTLFIIQTYIAACLWPDFTSFENLDTAFYDVAKVAGGPVLQKACSIATVISWGIANALAAQAAVSRILYSMGRDRNLPKALAKVHPKYKTPYYSTLLVAAISLVVGYIFSTKLDMLTSIVNFGALSAFVILHISVINHFMVRNKSKAYFKHLVLPLIGLVIIGYVWINLNPLSHKLGFIWLGIGIVYYAILKLTHREAKMDDQI